MNCFAGLEAICQADAPLGPHTWYRLGGPARWLLTPRDEAELRTILTRCREHGVAWRVLGRGANVVVRDEGVDAAVIKLTGPVWEAVRWGPETVSAAGGADFPALVRESAQRGLAGLENLAGIPGTVGGIIRMNAGVPGAEIGRCTRAVRVMDGSGELRTLSPQEVGFAYRRTNLAGRIVLDATFALERGDPTVLLQHVAAVCRKRAERQPPMSAHTAGSMFKNPVINGQPVSAGKLIDQAGLKGQRAGGAEISPKHANFIVAQPGATAQNVLDLIALARVRVRESAGIELELEVDVW